jgi:NACalpha-BTF3-like transcription factor
LTASVLAASRQRVHQNAEHPDDNHKVRQDDLDLIFSEATASKKNAL